MNWEEACQIIGVPPTASLVEIKEQYIYKANLLHPDKTSGLSEKLSQKASEELKQINQAYKYLQDTKSPPSAQPPKLNVSPLRIRFSDMEPGKTKETIIEIESVGGEFTKLWMNDSPAPWLRVAEVKNTTNNPLPIEVTIEVTGTPGLREKNSCYLPIRLENEKTKTKCEEKVFIELLMKTKGSTDAFRLFGLNIPNPFAKKPISQPQVPPAFSQPSRAPTGRIFLASDTHFDHANIIRYSDRPYRNVSQMNDALVNNWNRTVGRGDTVFFLGDLAFGRGARPPGYWLRKLNGNKILIRGSHDNFVRGAKNIHVINYNGLRFLLVHDPHDVKNWNGWVIHGHKHTDNKGLVPHYYPFINGQNKTINVNVELIGFKPISLEYICSLGLDRIKRMDKTSTAPSFW